MTEQCSSDISRCIDCSKHGKRFTSEYVSFCLYSGKEIETWTRQNCWSSNVTTEPMVMCEPPIELKGCDK